MRYKIDVDLEPEVADSIMQRLLAVLMSQEGVFHIARAPKCVTPFSWNGPDGEPEPAPLAPVFTLLPGGDAA